MTQSHVIPLQLAAQSLKSHQKTTQTLEHANKHVQVNKYTRPPAGVRFANLSCVDAD
jgi:hypothetical protein